MGERGIAEGMTVYDAEGQALGEVVSLDADGFLVERGLVFPKETFIRYEDVAGVSGHEIRLSRSEERLARVDESDRIRNAGIGAGMIGAGGIGTAGVGGGSPHHGGHQA
jgi:hypothetical protein